MTKHPAKQVVLIGCAEGLASRLRFELEELAIGVASELPDTTSAAKGLLLTLTEPRIFLVHVKSAEELEGLKRLTELFSGHPILAFVESGEGPALFLAANRAGAAQVVPLPLQRDDFRLALDRIGLQFGGAIAKSEVIAVAGVNGGCGATAIASNLAYEVACRRKELCILVELSVQIGRLANYFDVEPPYTNQDLFKDIEHLDSARVAEALTEIDEHFQIIVGPYKNLSSITVTPSDVKRLIHFTKRLAGLVFLDVPCTLDEHYFEVLTAADRIILVTEQKIPSLRSLKLVCDALDRMGPARPRVLVVNRYQPKIPGLSIKKLEDVLKTKGFLTVGNDFAAMNATLDHGRPLRLEAPKSAVLADIVALARVLFGDLDKPAETAIRGPFFSSLSRRLGLGTARG